MNCDTLKATRATVGSAVGVSPVEGAGVYLYGVTEGSPPTELAAPGIQEQPVYVIGENDLAAVVSNTAITQFDRFDSAELLKYATAHEQVLEALLKTHDLVPFSLGTIVPSGDEIRKLLKKVSLQFKVALDTIRGKAEFAVQVFWNKAVILDRLIKAHPEVQKLKEAAKNGTLDISAKIELGKRLHETVESQRKAYIEHISAALTEISWAHSRHKLIDEDMIANFSFLIEKRKESELDRLMASLGANFDGQLRFKYIGPMPPYSFTQMNLSLGNAEIIDAARRILGLGEEATYVQIKQAYHATVRKYHPDLVRSAAAATGEVEEQVKKIIAAYQTLREYVRNCSPAQERYSFRPQDVEEVFFVRSGMTYGE